MKEQFSLASFCSSLALSVLLSSAYAGDKYKFSVTKYHVVANFSIPAKKVLVNDTKNVIKSNASEHVDTNTDKLDEEHGTNYLDEDDEHYKDAYNELNAGAKEHVPEYQEEIEYTHSYDYEDSFEGNVKASQVNLNTFDFKNSHRWIMEYSLIKILVPVVENWKIQFQVRTFFIEWPNIHGKIIILVVVDYFFLPRKDLLSFI